MSKMCWQPIKDGEIDPDVIYMPAKRRKPMDLLIEGVDLFALQPCLIDVILAVVASSGSTRFFYETAEGASRKRYMQTLASRGAKAAKDYEARMRMHFRKYKHEFVEGYSLPEPPTPEIRAIYDSAAKWEGRPINPCGTTLDKGFSLGEYHWRSWPLSNLIDEADESIPK